MLPNEPQSPDDPGAFELTPGETWVGFYIFLAFMGIAFLVIMGLIIVKVIT